MAAIYNDRIIWASGANDKNIQAPPAEKQQTGWEAEIPPFEWFNWYMNRTDVRLLLIENALVSGIKVSAENTRTAVLKSGSEYAAPVYVVGNGDLKVYLAGLLCVNGRDYAEVGEDGSESQKIKWLMDVPIEYDIQILTNTLRSKVS